MPLLCEPGRPPVLFASSWRLQVAVFTVMLIGAAAADTPRAQSPSRTRSMYVTALDSKGTPVAGLTAADLSVKEDDKSQPVLSVGPARAKMAIALLVDDGGVGLGDFRVGIATFMNHLLGQATFSLVGIADQNRTLLDFTDNDSTLVSAVRGLQARFGRPEQHLVEAVVDALAAMQKIEAVRPVVVVLTNQAHESGNRPEQTVMDRLTRSGVVLQVVEVMRPSSSRDASQDGVSAFAHDNDAAEPDRIRGQVLGSGPTVTGGRRQELVASAGVPAAMGAIAEELSSQYVVVFGSHAEPDVPAKVSISTSRPGVKVHAPARVADRIVR
jgi:VWFA-related protein